MEFDAFTGRNVWNERNTARQNPSLSDCMFYLTNYSTDFDQISYSKLYNKSRRINFILVHTDPCFTVDAEYLWAQATSVEEGKGRMERAGVGGGGKTAKSLSEHV
jgi:hypothetical protein